MSAMFGHTWVSQYGPKPDGAAGDVWASALAGVTPAQIGAGLRAVLATGAEWPPSAPRFRAMCFGIPGIGTVSGELKPNSATRSAFARLVWEHLDHVRYRASNQDQGDRLLREAYDIAHEYVLRGGSLPLESVALPEPAPVDHGAKAMAAMREFSRDLGIELPPALDQFARTVAGES